MKTPTIKVLNAILRTDFHAFVQKVFETVSPNATYLDNWHIKLICSEISDMLAGNNRRMIINIPPRYMKSIICSVALPAFILGHNPKATVICVSYSDDLSLKFANDCRNVAIYSANILTILVILFIMINFRFRGVLLQLIYSSVSTVELLACQFKRFYFF